MWKWLLLCGAWLLAGPALEAHKGPREVKRKGTLHTGIVAIGGETTGTVLRTKEGEFELEFGKDRELRARAEGLNGKAVEVSGTLRERAGVEVRRRKIITVTGLKAAGGT